MAAGNTLIQSFRPTLDLLKTAPSMTPSESLWIQILPLSLHSEASALSLEVPPNQLALLGFTRQQKHHVLTVRI